VPFRDDEISALQRESANIKEQLVLRAKVRRDLSAAFGAAKRGLVGMEQMNFALADPNLPEASARLDTLIGHAAKMARLEGIGQSFEARKIAGAGLSTAIKVANALLSGVAQPLLEMAHKAGVRGVAPLGVGLQVADAARGLEQQEQDRALSVEEQLTGTVRQTIPGAVMNQLKGKLMAALGVPEDPVEREMFERSLPLSSRMVGEFASIAVLLALTRNIGAPSVGARATGLLSRTAPSLGRTGLLGKAGLIGAATGGVGGGILDTYQNPDKPDAMRTTFNVLRGAGLGYFGMTALLGRPFGLQARTFAEMEKSRKFAGWGRLTAFGLAHKFAPRLTVGYMTESALMGAAVATGEAMSAGKPVNEAILAGVSEAPLWIMGDLASARVGSTARWLGVATDVSKRIAIRMTQLGLAPGGAARGGGAAQLMIVNPAIGAAIGASAATADGQDPKRGAIYGGIAGGVGLPFLQRGASVLPRDTLRRLVRGDLSSLSGEEAGRVAQVIVKDAVDGAASQLSPAESVMLRRTISRRGMDMAKMQRDVGITRQIQALNREINELAPNEVLPTEPSALLALFSKASRMLQLRELEMQGRTIATAGQFTLGDGPRISLFNNLSGVVSPAEQFTRNKERFRLSRMATEARARHEAAITQLRSATLQRDAELAARLAAIEAGRTGTQAAETMLDFTARLNEMFNTRLTSARLSLEPLSIEEVYREIGRATGEGLNDITRRLGDPLAPDRLRFHLNARAAYDELAHLRAATNAPTAAITRPVARRTGLTAELQRDLRRYETLVEGVDDLLARSEAGELVTVEAVTKLLKKTGKGTVRGKTGGIVTIDMPFTGQITDFATAALRRARLYLRDLRPQFMLGPVGLGASLAESKAVHITPGDIPFEDSETGRPGLAWLGTPEAMATLGTLGMVLTRGFPVRYRGLARSMRALLQRSESRIFSRTGSNRETMIGLMRDGSAFVVRGVKNQVPAEVINKARRGQSVLFSLHNHPTRVMDIKALMPTFSLTDQRRAVVGHMLIGQLPSPTDIASGIGLNPRFTNAIMGIITPVEGRMTVVTIPTSLAKSRVELARGRIASALTKSRIDDLTETLQQDTVATLRVMRDELEQAGVRKQWDTLPAEGSYIAGLYGEVFGAEQFLKRWSMPYEARGIQIYHDVTDDALEEIIATISGRALRPSVDGLTQATETRIRQAIEGGGIGAHFAQQSLDPTFRSSVARLITGAPAAVGSAAGKAAGALARATRRILPESVTPQSASQPARTLPDIIAWGRQHGLSIASELRDGEARVVARHQGATIAEAKGIEQLMDKIVALAKDQQVMGRASAAGQAGFVNTGFGLRAFGATTGGVLGSLLGGLGGAVISGMSRGKYDTDPDAETPVKYALLGGIMGAIGGARLAGWALRHEVAPALKLFHVPTTDLLTSTEVSGMVGKASKRGGPTQEKFLRFPVTDQITHLTSRIKDMANTRGVDAAQLRQRFHNTLRKFAPSHIPIASYDALQQQVIDGAIATGHTPAEAHSLWLGMLVRTFTHYSKRGGRGDRPNLAILASQEAPSLFGNELELDKLRQIVATTDVMSGLPTATPTGGVEAAVRNFRQMLTPEAGVWKKLMEVADRQVSSAGGAIRAIEEIDTGGRGPFGLLGASFRPPEQYRTAALAMLARPETSRAGQMILDYFTGVNAAVINIRKEVDEYYVRLNNVFEGLTSREERSKIRGIIEDPAIAEQARTDNPALYEAAGQFRGILRELADRLGMPEQARIEDYFPWIYNSRSLEDMRKAKLLPDPANMWVPRGSGIPEYKVFRQLLSRNNREPLGNIIEDPLEAGAIYINGAIRKIHLDRVLARFNEPFVEELARVQPYIASDMVRWFLDIFGMPTRMQIASMLTMRKVGLNLERFAAAAGFNHSELVNEFIDRYFLGPGAPAKFSRAVRGFEFYSKLGGNFISPIVNLTQLGNTGTDLSLPDLLIGGAGFAFTAGRGRIAEMAEQRGVKRVAGFIDPNAQGRAKLAMGRSIGVWSDNTKRMLDRMHDTLQAGRQSNVNLILGGTLGGGLAGAAFFGDEDSRLGEFALGGAVGAGAATFATRVFRRSLQMMRDTIIFPFTAAEAINRSMTTGGALRAATRARAIRSGERSATGAVASEVAGLAGLGAGSAAAFEGSKGEDPTGAAAVGGVAGLGAGLASRNRPRFGRILGELDAIEESLGRVAFRKALADMGPITQQEVDTWYARQVLDMTQFRFGREGRAQILRTLPGELAGTLQSFTLNQIEFVGSRVQSFTHSLGEAAGAGTGVRAAPGVVTGGKLDVRIFRHLALIAGAAGALSAFSAGLDSDKGAYYWMSRIGFGLLPVLNYNEDAEQWQISDVGQHLQGPFFGDLLRATRTAMKLMTDPVAQRRFDEQLDTLSRQVFSSLKNLEDTNEAIAVGARRLHMEGIAGLVEAQQESVRAASHPVLAITGGRPAGRTRKPGGGSFEGGGFSGSGGFGEGGGF
jgi:hypothetical protein